MTSNLPPGAAAALTHPSGSKVYLVGVAHVSAKGQRDLDYARAELSVDVKCTAVLTMHSCLLAAAKDAEECILAVSPAIVVLELDKARNCTFVSSKKCYGASGSDCSTAVASEQIGIPFIPCCRSGMRSWCGTWPATTPTGCSGWRMVACSRRVQTGPRANSMPSTLCQVAQPASAHPLCCETLDVNEIGCVVMLQPLKLVFEGQLVEFALNVAYAVAGALLGVPPGEEFRAAIRAAERVLLSPTLSLPMCQCHCFARCSPKQVLRVCKGSLSPLTAQLCLLTLRCAHYFAVWRGGGACGPRPGHDVQAAVTRGAAVPAAARDPAHCRWIELPATNAAALLIVL